MGLLKTPCGAFFSLSIYYFSRKMQIKKHAFLCVFFVLVRRLFALTMRGFLKNISIIIPILYLYYTYIILIKNYALLFLLDRPHDEGIFLKKIKTSYRSTPYWNIFKFFTSFVSIIYNIQYCWGKHTNKQESKENISENNKPSFHIKKVKKLKISY